MKDSLFEILMNFFEKSLSQLKENNEENHTSLIENQVDDQDFDCQTLIIKSAQNKSIRIFTQSEQLKFTQASYHFIIRLMHLNIIASEALEQIINQLLLSESRFVTLEETKWTFRNALGANLKIGQLAFLDLLLYQKENALPLH